MKKIVLINLLIICIACDRDDNLKSGIATNINGLITDKEQKPLANVKIFVNEFKRGGYNGQFVKVVDSTFTNSEGKYEKTFYTTGSGNSYRLSIPPAPVSTQDFFGDVQEVEIKNIGSSFTFNNSFYRLYPIDITIDSENTTVFPILIGQGTTNTFQNNNYEILQKGTTTKRFYLVKNISQPIEFYRTVSANKTQMARYFLKPISGAGNYPSTLQINDIDFK